MRRYIIQRLVLLIPLLFAVSLVTFFLAQLAPGDPVMTRYGLDINRMETERIDEIREELGLNDPIMVQYLRYLLDLVRGDMGRSLTTGAPVIQEITDRLPATLQLTLVGILFVLFLAVPLGVISAVKRGSLVDNLAMSSGLLGVSMPSYFFGFLLMLFFALRLGWLPAAGRGDGTFLGALKALIMPAVTLGSGMMGLVTRLTRSSMLEVLGQDYMRTAASKGLAPRMVLLRHGLRNALIPVVTVVGTQFAGLLGGAVIIEVIFSWPGMGRLAFNAIARRDYPVIMGTVLMFAVIFVLNNLLIDILYTYIDPRIRYD